MCCIVPVTAVQGQANFNWRGIAGFQGSPLGVQGFSPGVPAAIALRAA